MRLPSVRLAHLRDLRHPMSIDLWIDKVRAPRQSDRGEAARRSRLVALRRRGALGRRARAEHRARRAARRGPRRPAPRCGLDLAAGRACGAARVFREGGRENLRALLRRLAGHAGIRARHAEAAARAALAGYLPGRGAVSLDALAAALAPGQPVVPILFYRSALLAADTAPIDALCEALAARGLAPAPLVIPSLKDAEAQRLRARRARAARTGGHRHHHGVCRRRRGRGFARSMASTRRCCKR